MNLGFVSGPPRCGKVPMRGQGNNIFDIIFELCPSIVQNNDQKDVDVGQLECHAHT